MQEFIIYGRLDNLNDYTYACRASKFGGNTCKKKNEKIVTNSILQDNIQSISEDDYPIHLEFNWYEQNGRRDIDNVCFAKKFILDSLSKNNIIIDDNINYVDGFKDKFYIDKDNPRIVVKIFTKNEK